MALCHVFHTVHELSRASRYFLVLYITQPRTLSTLSPPRLPTSTLSSNRGLQPQTNLTTLGHVPSDTTSKNCLNNRETISNNLLTSTHGEMDSLSYDYAKSLEDRPYFFLRQLCAGQEQYNSCHVEITL
jgi:hypothetical protein